MRLVHSLLLASCLMFATGSAFAADWAKTLPSEPLSTWVAGQGVKVVVVGAGEKSKTLDEASAQLVTSLRGVSAVSLVMDGASVGDASTLDDPAVVKKAGGLPIDQVFVVRVFPGRATGQFNIVVTMFKKDGTVVGAFSAATDAPLEKNTTAPGGAVSQGAVTAVTSVTQKATAELSDAQKQYEERYIWFQGYMGINTQTGAISTWTVPYKGKYKEPLKGAAFYSYIGRDDIAKSITKIDHIRGYVMLGGLAVTGLSTWRLLYKWEPDWLAGKKYCAGVDKSLMYDCKEQEWKGIDARNKKRAEVYLPVIATGVLAISVPLYIRNDKTPIPERYRMADEFNQNLRKELGLPEPSGENTPSTKPEEALATGRPAVTGWVTPWASMDGAGATLGIAF